MSSPPLSSTAAPSTTPTTSSTTLPATPSTPENPTNPQAEARAAVLASLSSSGTHYDAQYRRRAEDLHANTAALSTQETQLKKSTAALAKETAKFQKEIESVTKGLKPYGDLQNWAEMMEKEFLVLEETLRLVEGGEAVGLESGKRERRSRRRRDTVLQEGEGGGTGA